LETGANENTNIGRRKSPTFVGIENIQPLPLHKPQKPLKPQKRQKPLLFFYLA